MVDSWMSGSLKAQGSPLNAHLRLRSLGGLPVSQPPIREGAVLVSGKRISAVGRWSELSADRRSQTVDLGDAVLMPGLVNAHCHLDYTDMAGQFGVIQI